MLQFIDHEFAQYFYIPDLFLFFRFSRNSVNIHKLLFTQYKDQEPPKVEL